MLRDNICIVKRPGVLHNAENIIRMRESTHMHKRCRAEITIDTTVPAEKKYEYYFLVHLSTDMEIFI